MFSINEEKFPILGDLKKAEQLIEWSKRKENGASFQKDPTLWSLHLLATANGENPYIDVVINQPTLREFIEHLGEGVSLMTRVYGIVLAIAGDEVAVYIPQDENNVIPMFTSTIEGLSDEIATYLGRISIETSGPVFYPQEEVEMTENETSAPEQETETSATNAVDEFGDAQVDWALLEEELEAWSEG